MFQKDPQITNAIRSIKNYLKQLPAIERHNKAVFKKHESQVSVLQQPMLEEYNKISITIAPGTMLSFNSYKHYLKSWEVYKKELAALPSPVYLYPTDDVAGFADFDTTLIHILYNRLRNSTKSHLGTREKDDLYIARRNSYYFKINGVILPQYQALTSFVDSLGKVSLEAHKEQSNAS